MAGTWVQGSIHHGRGEWPENGSKGAFARAVVDGRESTWGQKGIHHGRGEELPLRFTNVASVFKLALQTTKNIELILCPWSRFVSVWHPKREVRLTDDVRLRAEAVYAIELDRSSVQVAETRRVYFKVLGGHGIVTTA